MKLKYLSTSLLACALSYSAKSQMVREEDPRHKGFVEGVIYKKDGSVLTGLVSFPYSHGKVKFKIENRSKPLKLDQMNVGALTMKEDSFATLPNVAPMLLGVAVKSKLDQALVKVLVTGTVSLYKHYSVQSKRGNMQFINVESFLLVRDGSDPVTVPTSKQEFSSFIADYFDDNAEFISNIESNDYSFVDLRDLVKMYNEGTE